MLQSFAQSVNMASHGHTRVCTGPRIASTYGKCIKFRSEVILDYDKHSSFLGDWIIVFKNRYVAFMSSL